MSNRMRLTLVLLVYNVLLPLFFIFAFPAWLLKMGRRGGIGSGLLERFGFFTGDALFEKQGVIYVHAVSVGEVLVAIKLINEWLLRYPEDRMLLVPTTATGHAVAVEHAPEGVRVIYSPLDFGFVLRRVFMRFSPKQIILMESEIWPNMLSVAEKLSIPVHVANARLSERSERRYAQLGFILRPLLELLGRLCAQDSVDGNRWEAVGVSGDKITVTGSIKFDQSGSAKPARRVEFSDMLEGVSEGKKVVMAISTHVGEEAWISAGLRELRDEICLVVVPRHAERRAVVKKDIEKEGYEVVLRSDYEAIAGACMVVDSTGELRDWTAHADLVVVGKSIIGNGGQNPTEAMSVSVPVISGEHMKNFEPLVTQLREVGGIKVFSDQQGMVSLVRDLLGGGSGIAGVQAEAALRVLDGHQGATGRTVEVLRD